MIKKFGSFLSCIWIISCIINLIGIEWIESYNNYSIDAIYTCKSKQIGNYIGISLYNGGSPQYTYSEANNFCINKYNTSLSSIHSHTDLIDNLNISNNLSFSDGPLIGLIYVNNTNNISSIANCVSCTINTNISGWRWADGTQNDYTMTLYQPFYEGKKLGTDGLNCTTMSSYGKIYCRECDSFDGFICIRKKL